MPQQRTVSSTPSGSHKTLSANGSSKEGALEGLRSHQKLAIENQVRNLFETNSVAQLRVIQETTGKDIEEKKQELRRLVGTRYRDLIDSADSILEMRDTTQEMLTRLHSVERHCHALRGVVRSQLSDPAAKERQLRRQKHTLAKQIRFLVDTPEHIWSALEQCNFFKATDLYLHADGVHHRLRSDPSSVAVLSSIPLLQRQWATIEQFPPKILDASRQSISYDVCMLSPSETAGALCALVLLDNQSSHTVFTTFLESRRQALLSALESAPPGASGWAGMSLAFQRSADAAQLSTQHASTSDNDTRGEVATECPSPSDDVQSAIVRLISCVRVIQSTLCQVSHVFVASSWNSGTPLLNARMASITQPTESPGPRRANTASTSASAAGGVISQSMLTLRMKEAATSSLAVETVRSACREWLAQCSEVVKEKSREILEGIDTATELASIEAALWSSIESPHVNLGDATPTTPAASTAPAPYDVSRQQTTTTASQPSGAAAWAMFSDLLLGGDVDLWKLFFQENFIACARRNFQVAFRAVSLQAPIDDILSFIDNPDDIAEAVASPSAGGRAFPHVETDLGAYMWSDDRGQGDADAVWRDGNGIGNTAGAVNRTTTSANAEGGTGESGRKALGISKHVGDLVSLFDAQLRKCMIDTAALLCVSSPTWAEVVPQHPTSTKTADVFALRRFLQRTCLAALATLTRAIERSVGEAQKELRDSADGGMPVAGNATDRLLFLGQLCRAVASSSTQLPAIMRIACSAAEVSAAPSAASAASRRVGSYSSVRNAASYRSGRTLTTKTEGEALLGESCTDLLRLCSATYAMWSSRTATRLGSLLKSNVLGDDWTDPSRRSSWEELAVDVEGEDGENANESVLLPLQPSSYVLSFLFSACQEIQRVGGHSIQRCSIQHFVRCLSQEVTDVYATFAEARTDGERREQTKEGTIQMVFDLMLLFDVLSGHSLQNDTLQAALLLLKGDAISVRSLKGAKADESVKNVMEEASRDEERHSKTTQNLLQQVQSRLDPIDIAFYEPHLKTYERRCYQRCAVVLGYFVQLKRRHTEVRQRTTLQEQHNFLSLAAPVSRFSLLPIASTARRRRELGGGASPSLRAASNAASSVSARAAAVSNGADVAAAVRAPATPGRGGGTSYMDHISSFRLPTESTTKAFRSWFSS